MDLMQPAGWDVKCRGVGARGKATPTRQGTKQQEARASNEACMAARGRRRQPDRDSEQDEEGVKDEEGAAGRLTGRCTSGREEGVKDEEGAKDEEDEAGEVPRGGLPVVAPPADEAGEVDLTHHNLLHATFDVLGLRNS